MNKIIILSLLLPVGLLSFTFSDFFTEQLAYPRVRQANADKGVGVAKLFASKKIALDNFDLFIRAFKEEQSIEIWAKNKNNSSYQLLTTYAFCATTGTLGPKRRSGDKQIPEGFYTIDRFNPESMYHLSFRLSYPNQSDLMFANKLNPGGDIFIHGDCITIGCIPIGNENIEELYLIAAKAKAAGGKTEVHIFPTRLTDNNYAKLREKFSSDKQLLTFWSWLKPGFDSFEEDKQLPTISIKDDGSYIVQG